MTASGDGERGRVVAVAVGGEQPRGIAGGQLGDSYLGRMHDHAVRIARDVRG